MAVRVAPVAHRATLDTIDAGDDLGGYACAAEHHPAGLVPNDRTVDRHASVRVGDRPIAAAGIVLPARLRRIGTTATAGLPTAPP